MRRRSTGSSTTKTERKSGSALKGHTRRNLTRGGDRQEGDSTEKPASHEDITVNHLKKGTPAKGKSTRGGRGTGGSREKVDESKTAKNSPRQKKSPEIYLKKWGCERRKREVEHEH